MDENIFFNAALNLSEDENPLGICYAINKERDINGFYDTPEHVFLNELFYLPPDTGGDLEGYADYGPYTESNLEPRILGALFCYEILKEEAKNA